MEIIQNPLNLVGKMRDYSWRGLLVHISAMLSGVIYWDKNKDLEKNKVKFQWGFLDIALLTGPLSLLLFKIHQNKTSMLFFHTAGLPILWTLTLIYNTLELVKELISSIITYAFSWPIGIASFFLRGKRTYSLYDEIGLVDQLDQISIYKTRSLVFPNVKTVFVNPVSHIIALNVKDFRSAGLMRFSLTERIFQTYHLFNMITQVPHSVVHKLIDRLDSNQWTQLTSLVFFPLRLALTILGSLLKAADNVVLASLHVVAMPIVLLVHACTLPGYKTLKSDLNTLEVHQNYKVAGYTTDHLKSDITIQDMVEANSDGDTDTYKRILNLQVLGKVKLETDNTDDEVRHSLVGKDALKEYRIELTQENSPIVLKALHNNAFRWASDLHEANQLDEAVEVLNDLIAIPAG